VVSHRRHRAGSFLPPQNGGRSFRAAMMSPSDLRCIFNHDYFTLSPTSSFSVIGGSKPLYQRTVLWRSEQCHPVILLPSARI